ncbi:MAG: RNB domain-containing ribonuclease, partial [Candidatus Acidiferrales bacterium]
MAHRPELTEQDVRGAIGAKREGTSAREIARALQLHGAQRKELQKVLSRMKHRRELTEVTSGRYVIAPAAGRDKRPAASQPDHPAGVFTTQGRSAGSRKEPEAGASGLGGRFTIQGRSAGGRKEPEAGASGLGGRFTPQGRAPERSGGRADANLFTGRIVIHRDGYGFVVPDEPVAGVDGDLFIAPGSTGDAMHGDAVAARIEKRRPDGRAEGRVVRIVRRAHPTVVGVFRYGDRGNVVVPFETRLGQEILIPPGAELTPALRQKYEAEGKHSRRQRLTELDGMVVDVELTRFPSGGVAPAGRVVEVVGRTGEMGVDTEIIIRKHRIPHRFEDDTQAEAEATPQQVGHRDLEGREDFRALPIVTIDGETAKDFDDAVHVRRLPGDHYELQVHIADVAHYVRPGSALDREARVRGTSVYFPGRAVPMLPEALSNGICSLNPQVDRLVMS